MIITATNLADSLSRDHSVNMDYGNCRLSDGETSVNNMDAECAQGANADSASIDVETRSALEVTSSHEDCSTSDANNSQTCSRRLRRSRLHSDGRRRKRWRGRVDWLEFTHDVPSDANKGASISLALDSNSYKLEGEQVS